jgi:hypothetical protein
MRAESAHTHIYSPVREALSVFRIGVDLDGGSTHADRPRPPTILGSFPAVGPHATEVPGEAPTPDPR